MRTRRFCYFIIPQKKIINYNQQRFQRMIFLDIIKNICFHIRFLLRIYVQIYTSKIKNVYPQVVIKRHQVAGFQRETFPGKFNNLSKTACNVRKKLILEPALQRLFGRWSVNQVPKQFPQLYVKTTPNIQVLNAQNWSEFCSSHVRH